MAIMTIANTSTPTIRLPWHWFKTILSVPVDDPELARSQLAAFAKQIPLLYGILLLNALSLAATHATTAPVLLTVLVPSLLCILCVVRIRFWLRHGALPVTPEQAIQRLRRTVRHAVVLSIGFTTWSLSLYPYGDAFAQCHVAFYMSITVISCIFCLMHLRSAALIVTGIVIVPFTVFFCWTGNVVLVAIALNLLPVTFGMIYILLRNYDDFAALIVSKRQLQHKQLETQRLSDENFRLANLDTLTGLPNRRRFMTELELVLTGPDRDGLHYAMGIVDLDGFKAVNDAYGHAAGDRLLAEVGRRLQSLASPAIVLARLGGDEFGILLVGGAACLDLPGFGSRLCALLREPYRVPDHITGVTGSVGLVAFTNEGVTSGHLLEQADYALYHAKKHRLGEAVIFSQDHEKIIREQSRFEHALRRADLDQEMRLAFQPIVDAASSRTIAYEALGRWSSPTLGQVGPDVFIPMAERAGLIGRLTRVLLTRTLAIAATWPEQARVAFNLSAQDLNSSDTIAAVRQIVIDSGIAPGRIDFEITETAVMQGFRSGGRGGGGAEAARRPHRTR